MPTLRVGDIVTPTRSTSAGMNLSNVVKAEVVDVVSPIQGETNYVYVLKILEGSANCRSNPINQKKTFEYAIKVKITGIRHDRQYKNKSHAYAGDMIATYAAWTKYVEPPARYMIDMPRNDSPRTARPAAELLRSDVEKSKYSEHLKFRAPKDDDVFTILALG